MKRFVSLTCLSILMTGCAALYGWDIHAPGRLSAEFPGAVANRPERLALYIPEGLAQTVSTDKGRWYSDPQTYHIGEALVPMLIEAFGRGFEEFILMEAEPTPAVMAHFGIDYLIVTEFTGFQNEMNLKGQGLIVSTQTAFFDRSLRLISRFDASGASVARGVFAKPGGPEVNLNAAIEANLRAAVSYVQDKIAAGVP